MGLPGPGDIPSGYCWFYPHLIPTFDKSPYYLPMWSPYFPSFNSLLFNGHSPRLCDDVAEAILLSSLDKSRSCSLSSPRAPGETDYPGERTERVTNKTWEQGMDYDGLWWVMMGYWVPHFDMIARVDLDTLGIAPSMFFAKTTVDILCFRFAWMVRG